MRHYLLIIFLMMGALACQSGGTNSGTDSDAVNALVDALDFGPSSFSTYVDVSQDHSHVRINFDFFPSGTDFNFEERKVTIPCLSSDNLPDKVNAQISAPVYGGCEAYTVISFDGDGEVMTVDGIVLPVASSAQKFNGPYGFQITAENVTDEDGNVLESDDGKLVDYYQGTNES